ncbi:MAG: GNAT family N-acetyltransferase [Planctomycetota bacterium]|jgi:RimJ/RimL family protein N-acetyltransferase
MTIRILNAEDARAFKTLRLTGLRDEPGAFASSYEEENECSLDDIAERLGDRSLGVTLGAFEGDELVGLTGVRREEHAKLAHKAFVWGVYVDPGRRNNGIGGRLMAEALTYAYSTLGVRQVYLGVNAENPAAIALYEKMGFVAYGIEKDFMLVDGRFHDEMLMVKFKEE